MHILRKEHEDLLVLLADQDNKLAIYRKRLQKYGESCTEDEEEDDNNDEFVKELTHTT